jgi:hypothetical protein
MNNDDDDDDDDDNNNNKFVFLYLLESCDGCHDILGYANYNYIKMLIHH